MFDTTLANNSAHKPSTGLRRTRVSAGYPAIDIHDDIVWAVTEGGEIAVSFNKDTLEETGRLLTRRPRDILATEQGVFVHASQDFEVARIGTNGKSRKHGLSVKTLVQRKQRRATPFHPTGLGMVRLFM